VGWFTAPAGGAALTSPYKLAVARTLYAHWKSLGERSTSKSSTDTSIVVRPVPGGVVAGTPSFGLRIKTTGTATTYSHATITLVRGSNAVIGGFGFQPGTLVHIYLFSKRYLLGVARVQKDGTYSGTYPVPAGLRTGRHSVETVGTTYDGSSKSVAAPVMVVSRPVTILIVPFAFDSSKLTPRLRAQVLRAAKTIVEYHVRALTHLGYTDPRGSIPYNLALSRRRTESVASYLAQRLRALHYPAKRLRLTGLGKTHVMHSQSGSVENAASRRVAITLELS
jgi:outer membrane protein OmpA-like peptidoglycan-associated protein